MAQRFWVMRKADRKPDMNDILNRQITKQRPRTQEDCVAIAVRQSLASYGEMPEDLRAAACHGIAKGLFGPAYAAADLPQRVKWFKMAKREYHRCAQTNI